METHELEIEITPGGEIKVHVKGVKSPARALKTRQIFQSRYPSTAALNRYRRGYQVFRALPGTLVLIDFQVGKTTFTHGSTRVLL